MFFGESKKNAGRSILEHFESKYPREKDEKPYWKEASLSKMADGGEVEKPEKDADHKESLRVIAQDMINAMESKSPGVLANALESFFEQCKMHMGDE